MKSRRSIPNRASSRVRTIWDGVAAMPKGRKGEETDEIVDAALKPLDLLSRIFGRGFHLSQLRKARLLYLVLRPRNSRRNSPGGTKNGFC